MLIWITEGSLAEFVVRHHLAVELVCGADSSWKLMCGEGPGDLVGVPGVGFGRESLENRGEDLRPDRLQVAW